MSNIQNNATERSPLLGDSSSQVTSLHAEPSEETRNDAEANRQTPESESSEVLQARKNVKQMLPVLSIGVLLAFLDQSVVAAISEDIGSDLGALRSVSWIATAYFLTMTCSQPLYGKLSDVFGRKPCLLFAYISFGVGSLGCGLTQSMEGLIAARVCHGFFETPSSLIDTTLGYSRHWRRWYADRRHRSALRSNPITGPWNLPSLSEPYWSRWINDRWTNWLVIFSKRWIDTES